MITNNKYDVNCRFEVAKKGADAIEMLYFTLQHSYDNKNNLFTNWVVFHSPLTDATIH